MRAIEPSLSWQELQSFNESALVILGLQIVFYLDILYAGLSFIIWTGIPKTPRNLEDTSIWQTETPDESKISKGNFQKFISV